MGIIIRDHEGSTVAMKCMVRPHITDLGTGEAMGAWASVELYCHLQLSKVIFEGDSLEIIQALRREEDSWHRFGHLIADAKGMLSRLRGWKI